MATLNGKYRIKSVHKGLVMIRLDGTPYTLKGEGDSVELNITPKSKFLYPKGYVEIEKVNEAAPKAEAKKEAPKKEAPKAEAKKEEPKAAAKEEKSEPVKSESSRKAAKEGTKRTSRSRRSKEVKIETE